MSVPSHEKEPQRTEALQETRTKLVVPILTACLVILAGLYSPWVLFISFAMLPTLLVRMVDKSKKRVLSFSVTGLNITGLTLALQHSYKVYGSSPQPGMLFQDWVNWALPFGLAWAGVFFSLLFSLLSSSSCLLADLVFCLSCAPQASRRVFVDPSNVAPCAGG